MNTLQCQIGTHSAFKIPLSLSLSLLLSLFCFITSQINYGNYQSIGSGDWIEGERTLSCGQGVWSLVLMLAGVLSSSGQAEKNRSAGLDTGVGRWIMSDRLHIAHRNGKNCKKVPVLVVTDWRHSTFISRFGAPVHLESCFYSVPSLIQWTYFKKRQQNDIYNICAHIL